MSESPKENAEVSKTEEGQEGDTQLVKNEDQPSVENTNGVDGEEEEKEIVTIEKTINNTEENKENTDDAKLIENVKENIETTSDTEKTAKDGENKTADGENENTKSPGETKPEDIKVNEENVERKVEDPRKTPSPVNADNNKEASFEQEDEAPRQTPSPINADGDKAEISDQDAFETNDITEKDAELGNVVMDDKNIEKKDDTDINVKVSDQPSIPQVPLPSQGPVSAVELATPRDMVSSYREEQTQPLNLEWTFGFNRRVGCINLSDSMRSLILYASAHIAVMYDCENNAQKLLQGHANAITCMACSDDKRWLVSADKGKESTVIVWDSYTGIPVQTIFNANNNQGTVAVTISGDAKYIITVSAELPQVVSVWDWTNSIDKPICSCELKESFGNQNYIQFHSTNTQLFVTNSESQVIFYSWDNDKLVYHAPPLSDDVFNRVVGSYSQSIFQINSLNRAFTATSVGNIVVWSPDRKIQKNSKALHKKRALKLVKMQDRAISTLTQTDKYIVTGDVMGQVKFYDEDLNMINWYQGLNVGPINSISFKYEPEMNLDKLSENVQYPDDATIPATRFIVKDFIVSTKNAEVTKVVTEGSGYVNILREHDASVHALAACPSKPVICIGSYAGLIKLWDFEKKQCVVTRVFDKNMHVQCIAFSCTGLEIAVGMTNGSVHIVDALALEDEIKQPFRYARDAITKCVFSHNSKYLATSDADNATTVFIFDKETGWKYLGRNRAHYKSIKDISFGVTLDSNKPRLLTLGEDRILVEYDLENSSKDDLRLLSVDRLEQSAVPQCLAWYPPVTKESFLVTSNDQYKFKLFNATTKMCRKTLLAPTYGSPIKKMVVIPLQTDEDQSNRILGYITNHKVGLQMLPLDGNPHRSVATVAHPGGVSHLTCSSDGNYIFTAGGKDSSVHMWAISRASLNAAAALGGEDLIPFYGLLEGGRDGELFAELENYFYYAQLRTQGLDTTDEREASTTIDIQQVPFVMRALGFYPSEQEIEDMLNEIKFSKYVDTSEYIDKIDLGDLIKLYINHRPAFGLSVEDLQNAFNVLGKMLGSGDKVEKMKLMNILQRKGEHMTEQELAEYLATLLGCVPEGGSTEMRREYFVGDAASEFLESALPDNISADLFSEQILGLPVYED